MASKEKVEQLAVGKRKITIQWAYRFSSHDEWKMATSTKEAFLISRLLVTSKQCRQTLLILKLFQASVGLLMGQLLIFSVLQGSVSQKPRKLFGPVKPYWAKSRTLYTNTELFYLHILNLNRSPLHTRSFRRIQFSVFRYRWIKNDFTGPKSLRDFRETGPWSRDRS